ncbi:SMI1/KNR4 family protein [Streptomyces caelestis]|uniref:SMI1/KNR4 family protein n=1 Tax=Streptomyces caelestis TaxID=36816 RepID=UPI0036F64E8D
MSGKEQESFSVEAVASVSEDLPRAWLGSPAKAVGRASSSVCRDSCTRVRPAVSQERHQDPVGEGELVLQSGAALPLGNQLRTCPAPLSEAEIREAEAELGIAFPDQYREYLRQQDADGAVNHLCRSAAGWGWHEDSDTNCDLLTTAFPHPDSYRVYEDELDAREPLKEDFSDHNTYKAAGEQWGAEYEVFQERKTSGAVFIQDNGCGFSTLLVVTGPHRGSLWFDGRATCDQILPLNLGGQSVSFTDWLARRYALVVRSSVNAALHAGA